ncbi:hypothetical protein ABDJ41_10200 [Pedobacter sp. ASV1-7]|uniref:hypothetical protein n=1 Tax=Pedobacter sp. ASV1-7 TaxID=3145237 RepID=UPI0032E91357
MFKQELEEYKSLVGQANAYFDLQRGTTLDSERGVEQSFLIEEVLYNNYRSLDRYKAKLKSLTTLLEVDIRYIEDAQKFGIGKDSSLIDELEELERLFIDKNGVISHKGFKLVQPNTGNIIKIEQGYYAEFIRAAYDSVHYLNGLLEVEVEFRSIFNGSNSVVDKNIAMVDGVLVDLGITNIQGDSIIKPRNKGTVWMLIDILKENNILKISSELVYINAFWKYIKASGKPPSKPHRESKLYSSKLIGVKDLLKNKIKDLD